MQVMDFFRFGRLIRDRSGAMFVEFSLVMPLFFFILIGSLTIKDAMSAYNRVQNVSNAVGVALSRLRVVTNRDMVGIASAARAHVFPFPQQGLSIFVAAAWIDNNGTASVLWCERWGSTRPSTGTCVGQDVVGDDQSGYWVTQTDMSGINLNIPQALLDQGHNSGLVVVHVSYEWSPPYGPASSMGVSTSQNMFTMNDTFFTAPRADVTLLPPSRVRNPAQPTRSFTVDPVDRTG